MSVLRSNARQVTPGRNKSGTKLLAEVRGKTQSLTVTKMPFVEQRYYRGP